MLRRSLVQRQAGATTGFRWRSHEITRIEGLSDAVFAFAVTLLVVSLEVPHTFSELAQTMRGFLAFAISFLMLFWIWYQHFIFSRRYGLQDPVTVSLTGVLLFVVLFYVYPLKFLWTVFANMVMGAGPFYRAPGGAVERMIEANQVSSLMAIYGLGFAALFLIFALMYRNAHRRRVSLELTPLEAYDTREKMREHGLSAGIGIVSVALALLLPAIAIIAVVPYWLLGLVQGLHGRASRKRRERLAATLDAAVAAEMIGGG